MISSIFKNSFLGLRKEYFIRNFVIGMIFSILVWVMIDTLEARATHHKPFWDIVFVKAFFVLNGFLYPYAKFLYDSFWDLLIGDKIYVHSINIFTIWFQLFTRVICWGFSWILAPIGLIILYFKNK